jgi:AcrR family transcriptional regulator
MNGFNFFVNRFGIRGFRPAAGRRRDMGRIETARRAGEVGAPGPGRRARQKAERERRILRAAEVLFARRGYARTGMEDIARRAQLAVGTIYNYFASKPEIVLALLRSETAATLAAGEAAIASAPEDPAEAVSALLDVYVDLLARHERGQLRELLAAALAQPETIGRAAFEMDLRLVGQLHGLLGRLAARGRLRAGVDPGAAATTLYAVYLAWLLAFASSDAIDVETVRAQVRRGIGVAVAGIGAGTSA